METTSTLSQELLRAAVAAEPEIAERMQALVETMEGMIRRVGTVCRGRTGDAVRVRYAE